MGAKAWFRNGNLWTKRPSGQGAETIHSLYMDSSCSSQQDLLQLRVIARELLIRLAQLLGLAAGVEHGGVGAASERLADLRKALLGELLGERHRDLARPGHGTEALLRVHLRDLDLEVVGDRLLHVVDGHLP